MSNPKTISSFKFALSLVADIAGAILNLRLTIDGPTLDSDDIVIDNTTSPNTITLTFNQELDSETAENTENYTVTNTAGNITYDIDSASLDASERRIVTLNLQSTITANEVNGGITVTPSEDLLNAYGDAYNNSTVTASTTGHNLVDDTNNATDTTAPTAPTASITYSETGPYSEGAALVITATFSEAMATDPTTQIALNSSDASVDSLAATAMTPISSTTYTFEYPVPAGNATMTISLSQGTDLAGNVVEENPTAGNTFVVDNTPPTAAIAYSQNGPYQSNDQITITATFNKEMAQAPLPQIMLTSSEPAVIPTVNATNMVRVDARNYTYTYVVPDGNATMTITLSNGADLAGNAFATDSSNSFEIENPDG